MLDQNTDRMWYVIGALVVGAGVILLVNKTMPEVFAKVGKTFEGITDGAIGDLENDLSSAPEKTGNNLILKPDSIVTKPNHPGYGTAVLKTDEAEPYYRVTPVSGSPVSTYWSDHYTQHSTSFSEPLVQGETYTVFVDVRVPVVGRVAFYNQQGAQQISKANEWTTIHYTFKFDKNNYIGGRIIGNSYSHVSQYLDYKNWYLMKGQ